MNMQNKDRLNQCLNAGKVYRRSKLAHFTTAVDRDLASLVNKHLLVKVGPGLYYKPRQSRYGPLPPDHANLVKAFLRDGFFLVYSWNEYNKLGLGLTQLYNRMVVYNRKRHGVFKLGHKEYDFRCTSRGFPKKLTREFLLVDLLNNLKELDEDPEKVKRNIKKFIDSYDVNFVMENARLYGKVATLKFLEGVCYGHEEAFHSRTA